MNNKKFIVVAPSWIPQSGGITVLHKLANDLNLLGYDTYLAPTGPHGLQWHPSHIQFNTYSKYDKIKFITEEVMDNLDDAIVIYPEVWYGNLLNAPNVVRWMLGETNPIYMKSGITYGIKHDGWEEKDLWFYFTPLYTTNFFNSYNNKNKNNILTLTEFHRDIFKNKNKKRTLNSWTLRKGNGIIKPTEYIHDSNDLFFGDVLEGIDDFAFAGKFNELSNLLNISNRFYSYDHYTFVNIQAAMCGATSIVCPKSGLNIDEFKNGYELNKYVAYGINDIKNTKPILNEITDHINQIEDNMIEQLHKFVEKCNDYFK